MKGPLPGHAQLDDFLAAEEHRALLDWVLGNEDRFAPATVTSGTAGSGVTVDPDERIALTLRDLGPLQAMIEDRLMAALPYLRHATGTGGPMPQSLELELAAHGDGAHFVPHLDMSYGTDRRVVGGRPGAREDRLLSGVLYFHVEPKAFSGGQLHLYRVGGNPGEAGPDDRVEIEPRQNSLAVFPSWALHEVRTVHCPSKAFHDYRFALNCWFCASLSA
jgi:hypothetical protein